MGTKKLANGYLVWVKAAAFAVIRGQQGASITRSASEIDLETKDDEGYGATAFGNKKLSVSLSTIPSLPDVDGYEKLEELCAVSPAAPFEIQIRKGGLTGADPADVVFEGLVYGNLDSTDFEQNSGVGVKIKFAAAAAPTVDKLK